MELKKVEKNSTFLDKKRILNYMCRTLIDKLKNIKNFKKYSVKKNIEKEMDTTGWFPSLQYTVSESTFVQASKGQDASLLKM